LEIAMSWLVAGILAVRAFLQLLPVGVVFVLATALSGAVIEEPWLRLAIGIGASIALPLLFHLRVAAFLTARKRKAPSPDTMIPLVNAILACAIAFGFADDVGRALRRRGDWFVGERNGAVARGYRAGVLLLAGYLEKFDPPAELRSIVIAADPKRIPMGPWRPGETPPEAEPVEVAWFHPLAGPQRAMPLTESRRFGAARPQPRPAECELGHCGVDLGSTLGEPVFAVFDGVVERVERDESAGGRAGRYVRIGHRDGTVVTRYIHLDTIRDDLKEGARVRGGELIGRLGRSGVFNSGPHLHFAVSMRPTGPGGAERYVDPEPLLRRWKLPDATSLVASR
jgi:hypothetical protein